MSKSEFAAVAAFAFATALAIASTAAAAEASGSNEKNLMTRTVTYTDADLRTVAGAEGLALRTRQAAAYVCGGDNVLLLTSTGYRRCMKDAVDRAIAGLNAPLLREALHRPVEEMARR
jgi:UrcA family protein